MRHRRTLLIAASTAAAVGLGAAASADAADAGPPPPPWVNEDGTVDMTKVPERLPVSGPNGEIAGYIDSDEVFGPPPLAPGAAAEAMRGDAGGRSSTHPGPIQPNDEEGGIQQEVPMQRSSEQDLEPTP